MTDRDSHGMSFREILSEVRDDVKEVKEEVDNVQITLVGLDKVYVTKAEYQMWQDIQRGQRRWAITTIVSLAVLGMTILSIILANTP